jgi:lysophospholipase L1-like esterase
MNRSPSFHGALAVACVLVLSCAQASDNPGGDTGGGGGSVGAGGAGQGDGGSSGAGSGGSGAGGADGRADAGAGSGGASGAGGSGAGGAGGRTGTLRIMPLGDSTTGSVCWRALLWQRLNQNGYTARFDFIGSRNSDAGCTPTNYDKDNEGHPGVLVTNFVTSADGAGSLQNLFGPRPADVVLFHFATNDVWNNIAPATILAAYGTVVDALRAANPNVTVLVAKIIPMNPVNTATCSTCACPTCGARVTAFNDMIPAWATSKNTAASRVVVVDQWTGFNANMGNDTDDGVHPNASGSMKIANRWYDAVIPYF